MSQVKKIDALIKQLISFAPDITKLERAPAMIPIPRTKPKHEESGVSSIFNAVISRISSGGHTHSSSGNHPTTVAGMQQKVAPIVKELTTLLLAWIVDWRKRIAKTASSDLLRPTYQVFFPGASLQSSSPALPLEQLIYIQQQLMELLGIYKCFLHHVEPLVDKVLPSICEQFQLYTMKSTAPHWFYLPAVAISEVVYSADAPIKILRHDIDHRWDSKELIATSGRVAELTMKLLDRFLEAGKKTYTPSTKLAGRVTATYPYVPAAQAMGSPVDPSADPNKLVLLNDPNNDGILIVVGDGWMCGAVVDGSGAGFHAYLAAQILLATMLDMAVGKDTDTAESRARCNNNINDLADMSAYRLQKVPWKTSHDCMNFLEKVARESHRVMVDTDGCGATTCLLYTMTEMADEEMVLNRKASPTFKEKFGRKSAYVLNYLISGDTEGWVYSNYAEAWETLQEPPRLNETIRLNTSITPGGLGKYHGSRDRIFGAYLWKDFQDMRKGEDYPRSEWVDFYAIQNNLHFGQYFLGSDDYVLFSSDGLGDTIDPIQVFPRPRLIHGLEHYKTWSHFGKTYPNPQVAVRMLKEMIFNSILHQVMTSPVAASSDAIEETGKRKRVSAWDILEACIDHSMAVTEEERRLYQDQEFWSAQRPQKHQIMERKINMWIDRNMPIRTQGTPLSADKPFSLPGRFVPFAKVDHLGIQVVNPRILLKLSSQSQKLAQQQ